MKRHQDLIFFLAVFILGILGCQTLLYLIPEDISFHGGAFVIQKLINKGFFLGSFGANSPLLRIVFAASFLGLIYTTSLFIYFYLSPHLTRLKSGLSFLLTGFSSNIFEKVTVGHVVDYISLNLPYLNKTFFNLADTLQAIGMVLIIWDLFTKQNIIWFPTNVRRKILINQPFQFSFIRKICALLFTVSLTLGLLSYAFIYQLMESSSLPPENTYEVLKMFLISYLCLMVMTFLLSSFFLLKFSHQIVGPLFALLKFLKQQPAEGPLKFREGDYFKDFEAEINTLYEGQKSVAAVPKTNP
jgi:lipoprotein signal peptidase